MADIKVKALMTIHGGTKDSRVTYPRGSTFTVPSAEAERLMLIGAVSISGERAEPVPLPAEVQPTEATKK
ncbi:hypothetical protein [Acidocella sp.]|uniref:hypothetical protein n=1 Tax=Acidocella sp. TaxID=50710 RepID=UPI00263204C9|nr:hypothetical protein [Acidocella sp.]MDD2794367.1 hypothetical protein [Acidocella sp.]